MQTTTTSYTVGGVAELARVTVRTLHHYDRIGLLVPEERSEAGYRRYSPADLERLHRILSYRELGLSLEDIAALLDDLAIDPVAHLRRQERLLGDRIGRLEEMLVAVRWTMEAHQMGIELTPQERFELFGDFDPAEHAEEAEQRWGATEAFEQSRRRAASYSKRDWQRMTTEHEQANAELAASMRAGEPADGSRATEAAEAARALIDRWFYDCSPEVHSRLADMYVADPRFAKHYEDRAEGLSRYVRDAIHANARRIEIGG